MLKVGGKRKRKEKKKEKNHTNSIASIRACAPGRQLLASRA